MKKITLLLLALTVLLSCAACGTAAPTATASPAEPASSGGTVVTVGPAEPEATEVPTATSETETPAQENNSAEPPKTTKPVTANVSPFLTDTVTATAAFETMDMDGNTITQDFFSQNKLTMVNFWEPWCGPCVGEMPELQKLYEDYSDKGFAILGVYSTPDGVAEVVSDSGVKYPIVNYVSAFNDFQTGYVPTTIFVNGNGEVISLPVAGSNTYDGWAEIVEYYLG